MDITDRIIEKYKKDRSIKDTYVLNDDEMYLIDEIVQLKIGLTLPLDNVIERFGNEPLKANDKHIRLTIKFPTESVEIKEISEGIESVKIIKLNWG